MSATSTTFGDWKDRATYLIANAQFLILGLAVSLGAFIVVFRPSLPGIPPIVVGWVASLLLLGPAVFGFFVWLVQRLRQRRMVTVHHVAAVEDEIEKYYVEPGIWREKTVEGPNPYPINGGSAWGVQEFEWLEDVEELRVKGVWMEETQDAKLISDKRHMEQIYGKLTESHIAFQIFRDSVSEFGSHIQRRLINSMVEARERGRMMDKSAIKDVFDDFEEDANSLGVDDLPHLEPDEDPVEQLAEATAEEIADQDDGDRLPSTEEIRERTKASARARTNGGPE